MNRAATIRAFISPPASEPLGSKGLPTEVLHRVRLRFVAVARLMCIIGVLGMIATGILTLLNAVAYLDAFYDLTVLGISAAAYVLFRSPRLTDSQVLNLGAAYEITICALLSVGVNRIVYANFGQLPILTMNMMLIPLFTLMAPTPPLHTLLVSLMAAICDPVVLWVTSLRGFADVTMAHYVFIGFGNFISVVVAVVSSRLIYSVTLDAAKAKRMGSYQLEAQIGRGGMGEVWLARHRLLARPAAIKLVRPDRQTEQDPMRALQRFEREAQVTANLASPHSVDLYDFGVTDDGTFYYVMELLDGITLETAVQELGPMPPERVVYLLLQICDSLAEAHESGLIHRDIKPANIMICRQGLREDFVKVLDFGLVALHPELAPKQARLSMDLVLGTPAYMAPEVVAGAGAPVDQRIDIYSVGCVAYWLLTGQLVFQQPTPMATLIAHVNEAPVPPSQLAVQEIPAALDELVLQCLRKNPAERPQNASELIERLEALDLAAHWTRARAAAWWAKYRASGADAKRAELVAALTTGSARSVNSAAFANTLEAKIEVKPEAKIDAKPEAKIDVIFDSGQGKHRPRSK